MKKLVSASLVSSFVFAGLGLLPGVLAAQNSSAGATPPPKVLVIMREFLKPGKTGSAHEKTESAFVQAFQSAKWPTHYLGMDSLSGPSRSLFFVRYDSFAAWEKDIMDTQKNSTFAAALDQAQAADGELLSGYGSSTFVLRDDLSLRPAVNIPKMRMMEIIRFHVRAGHERDWESIAKMYVSGFEKSVPDAHWATYEDVYGAESGGTYLVLIPRASAAEIDQGFADSKKFAAAIGEEGMKKIADLSAASTESSESNLFMFNPKISYVSDDWIKADPSFWHPQ